MKDIYKTRTMLQLVSELALFEERLTRLREKKKEIDNSSHGVASPLYLEERRIAEHIAFLKKLIGERE